MAAESREAREGSRNRVAFENARLRLARLRQDSDEARAATISHAVQISATALGVDRVSVWMLRDGGAALECLDLYALAGQTHERGMRLLASDFPCYFAALRERRALVAHDARTDPLTRELTSYLVPRGITSLLDAPIIRNGEVVGVVCHEHVGPPREWSQADMAFSASVADIVTTIMEQGERIELEARLRHDACHRGLQTKMEALGRMATAVTHDFNNILSGIGLLARELAASPDPKVWEPARDIVASVEAASHLTLQLRTFGREKPATPRRVSLAALLDQFRPVLTTAMGAQVDLSVTITEPTPELVADPAMLEQIVLNLCTNARDALEGKSGHVQVRVRPPHPADDLAGQEDRYLVLEVADDGHGMDEATQERIFEPYYTTRADGTGLGLATVYHIVEELNGFLSVASEPGKGSTFSIALPRTPGT